MPETSTLLLTDDAVTAQVDRLRGAGERCGERGRRFVLGIAGIAGSGKSTLGERLTHLLNTGDAAESAVFVPMDGFHLSNAVLDTAGTRSRKGAWFTYDAEGYAALLRRYADLGQTGGFPVYCREVHEPVPSSQRVTETTRLIITEGQYLLVDEPPWSALGKVLDEAWWIDLAPERARVWLRQRDLAVGRDPDQAEAKYQTNDRLNTDWVLAHRRRADLHVAWPDQAG